MQAYSYYTTANTRVKTKIKGKPNILAHIDMRAKDEISALVNLHAQAEFLAMLGQYQG